MRKIGAFLLLLFVIFSCGKSGNNDKIKKEKGTVTKDAQDVMNEIEKKKEEVEKYNRYVEVYNNLGNMDGRIIRYFEEAGNEEKVRKVKGSFPVMHVNQSTIDNVKQNLSSKVKMDELDKAAKDMLPYIEELKTLAEAMESYYEGKDFVSDNYAKAQEIHSRLFPLVQSYIDPADAYTAAIHSLSVERQQEEMQRMKDNGLTIRYDMLRIMDLKNQIIDAFSEQPNVAEANIADLDLTKIRPAYDELATLLLEFVPLSKDKDAAEKEGFDNNYYVTTFADAAGDFKKQLQEMIDRKESGKGFSENDLQILWATDGSFQKISEAASQMTETYNRAVG